MRSLHDLAEYDLLHKEFDTLTDGERDTLLAARKVHKEQVIFLHEWAHTLGVIHAQRASAIMNPAYDASMAGFDAVEAQLLDAALRHRASDGAGWRAPTATEFRSIIDATPDADWDPRDRQQLVALVAPTRGDLSGEALHGGLAAARAGVDIAVAVDIAAAAAGRRAARRRGSRRARATRCAWRRRAATTTPGSGWRRSRRTTRAAPRCAWPLCELAWRHPSGAARAALAEVACRGAIELAPADPRPHLYLADIYLSGGDAARARAPLEAAAEALAAASVADADVVAPAGAGATAGEPADAGRARRRPWWRRGRGRGAEVGAGAAPAHGAAASTRRRSGCRRRPKRTTSARSRRRARPSALRRRRRASRRRRREFHGLPAAERLRCEAALHRGLVADVRAACSPLLPLPSRASLAQLRAAYARRFER